MQDEFNIQDISPQNLLQEFFKNFDFYTEEENQKISKAWNYLVEKTEGLMRGQVNPYYLHPMRVAFILAKGKFDADTIIAGFFHNLFEQVPDCEQELGELFGQDVLNICSGTTKISTLKINSKTMQQADSIRKMLFAMIDDIRVIFVKLADRLDRMRNLKGLDESTQKSIAKEVIDIWAPLAGRLGIGDLKNELEDLSLKYTNPDAFQQIKQIVSLKKDERNEYLQSAVKKIFMSAQKMGIEVQIKSRAKHFYSIYQKMKKRNKEAGELYDLLALRIICEHESECYTLIGIVHGLWKPLDGRFKDYIAMPKANGYQSLHTTVLCEGKPLEIQIRTQEMHNVAEHGVASHWLYKKGTNHDMVKAQDLSIINQLKSLRSENLDNENFFEQLKDDLLGDEIFVFTPAGDVIQLPSNSNAIDFAYAIHSAVGEKIVGAKADGKIIQLTTPLQNTQVVEILTSPGAHPTQNQYNQVHTSKARQKIRNWLLANDPTFVDKDLLQKQQAEKEANNLHSKQVEHQKYLDRKEKGEKPKKKKNAEDTFTGKIKIGKNTNFLISIAKCCNPQKGDEIVGYVSRFKGIVIHRKDCFAFGKIRDVQKRAVEVEWDQKQE